MVVPLLGPPRPIVRVPHLVGPWAKAIRFLFGSLVTAKAIFGRVDKSVAEIGIVKGAVRAV